MSLEQDKMLQVGLTTFGKCVKQLAQVSQYLVTWTRGQATADITRHTLWTPVWVGIGIAVYFEAPKEPELISLLFLLPAFGVWLWTLRSHSTVTAFIAASMFWSVAGFSAAVLRTAALATPVLEREVSSAIVSGRVEQIIPLGEGRTRIVALLADSGGQPKVVRARITLRQPYDLTTGQWIRLRAGLRPPPPPVAPGAYDFGRFLWFQGIGAVGFAMSAPQQIDPLRDLDTVERVSAGLADARSYLSKRIMDAMSPDYGPIATAFLTGDRNAIDEDTLAAFRDSSLAHALSISGLHMALAGFGFFNAIRLVLVLVPVFAATNPVKKYAAFGALIASFAYLMISGAATPTVRSFIMIGLIFIAMIMDRPGLALRQVAVAALLILLFTPEALIDVSFQMSFAAVVALVAAYEWLSSRPRQPNPGSILDWAWAWLSGAALTSLVAGLATTPFSAFHFHRVSDYGVVANIVALPAIGLLVMPAGVIALLAMPFGLEYWPLQLMELGLSWVVATAYEVASWPGAAMSTPQFSDLGLMLTIVGALWLCLWRQIWRLAGIPLIIAGMSVALWTDPPDVIIAADAKTFAIRDARGVWSVPPWTMGKFETGAWLKAAGDARTLDQVKAESRTALACTRDACRALSIGGSILFVKSDNIDEGECRQTALIIDRTGKMRTCAGPTTYLGPEILNAQNAIALRYRNGAWRIQTTMQTRGQRPWAPSFQ